MDGTANRYANIRVNAGETVIFSVEAQTKDHLISNLAKVYIHAPSAGEFMHLSLVMIMTYCIW